MSNADQSFSTENSFTTALYMINEHYYGNNEYCQSQFVLHKQTKCL
jgi:hypothetical protein